MFEMRRRGVVFGWTPEFMRDEVISFSKIVSQYHGYLASFGITLTFWYHTMETTFAHVTGFFHVFLLLWQSSLLYQTSHRNRYWTALLEVWILVHGSVVAYYQGRMDGVLYLMFLTSFTLLFSMSTFWGLPIVQRFIGDKTKPERYWLTLAVVLPLTLFCCLWQFWAAGKLLWTPMMLALPGLYYLFTLWYYSFYFVGKWLDRVSGMKRQSRLRWLVMSAVGSASILTIMYLSWYIYRAFVPVHKYPGKP